MTLTHMTATADASQGKAQVCQVDILLYTLVWETFYGMQVLIPAPYWVSYPEMAKLAGAEPVILDCPAEHNFLLTAEQLKASLTPQSRVLILVSPSNPTGSVYSK